MEAWLVKYQVFCRLAAFCTIFALLAYWETKRAGWPWLVNRLERWQKHLSLALFSTLFVRLVFPFLAVTTAFIAEKKGLGFFNQNPTLLIAEIIISILFLDLVMYFQHRIMHNINLFWRVHRVHHMDRHLDVSTGVRFHPLEAAFTTAFKLLAVAFIGAPVVAVFVFEVIYNAMTMFVHANVYLPPKIDRPLRQIIVTPNMHRIHHSDYPKETNSNYGFCFSWWDQLFGTYTARSISGEFKINLGLETYRDKKFQTFENMLLVPFNLKRLKVRHKKRVPSRMA